MIKTIKIETPKNVDSSFVRYPSGAFMYLAIELENIDTKLNSLIDCSLVKPDYDAKYVSIEQIIPK